MRTKNILLFAFLLFFFGKVNAQMSGTYSIGYGADDDYELLNHALQYLNTNGADGAVIFELSADYNPAPEEYPIYIQPFAGASEINTLTIKPAPGTSHVIERDLSSAGSAIFAVIDGSHFILDGSNNGTDSRDLTISSIGTDTQTGAVALYTNVTPGTDITIKNCILKAGAKENVTTGIYSDYFTNVFFENNKIFNARIGIITFGDEVTIINNEIGSDVASEYLHYGISAQYGSDITISGNNIYNLIDNQDFDAIHAIAVNDLTGDVIISNNYIDNLVHTGLKVVQAIAALNCNPDNFEISNNRISNIASDSYSDFSDLFAAIAIFCPEMTSGMKILYNSIYMPENNTYGAGLNGGGTYITGILIESGTGIILKNNIISNQLGMRDGGTGMVIGADVLINAEVSPFVENDNNLFFVEGDYSFTVLAGSSNNPMDLAAWQTWTGGGFNSFFEETLFISNDDLNLQACSPAIAHAVDIVEITTDIEGNTRDTQYPTMGAYEYDKVQASELFQIFPCKETGWVMLNWQYGSGCKSAVFMKEGNYISNPPIPENGMTYTSNEELGLGTEIGTTGWFCVTNDISENAFSETTVVNGVEYTVMVCEYFGREGKEVYLTETSTDNLILVIGDNSGKIEKIPSKNISIYPNPTSGKVTLKIDQETTSNNQISDISISNITGKVIYNKQFSIQTNKIELDLSDYGKGLYFVKIKTNEGIITKKLILQ